MNYTIIGGDGKQYGPVTEADLRQWIAEGRLNAQSLAKAESDAEFRPLSTFPEFASAFGAPAAPPSLPGMAPPLGASPDGRRVASDKVQVPAVGLMISAIVSLIEAVWGLVRLRSSVAEFQRIESQFQQMNNPQAGQFMRQIVNLFSGPVGIASMMIQIIIAILILIGAIKMKALRSYEFAFAAAILSVIPCINPCCGWILGLIFGIWSLVVLSKPEVKSQFA
jgi:hypothetical protein